MDKVYCSCPRVRPYVILARNPVAWSGSYQVRITRVPVAGSAGSGPSRSAVFAERWFLVTAFTPLSGGDHESGGLPVFGAPLSVGSSTLGMRDAWNSNPGVASCPNPASQESGPAWLRPGFEQDFPCGPRWTLSGRAGVAPLQENPWMISALEMKRVLWLGQWGNPGCCQAWGHNRLLSGAVPHAPAGQGCVGGLLGGRFGRV